MSNDIAAQLKGLKLHGMASTWPELLVSASDRYSPLSSK